MRVTAKRIERGVRNFVRGLPGERWEHRPHVSDDAPVIIGGCGRSGTTLTSLLVNAHPSLCCGPETRLFTTPGLNPARLARHYDWTEPQVRHWIRESQGKAQFIERFFREVAAREGKVRWAEKTPGNVHVLDRIFEHFPRAKFVHVIRDGRDVACSYRTHPKYRMVKGKRVPTGINRPIAECARRWNDYVRAAIRFRPDERYHEMRYEQMIENPERTLRAFCDFIGEPWDDSMLRFHERRDRMTRMVDIELKPIDNATQGRWRKDLSAEDSDIVRRIAGELLIELGYAADENWSPDTQRMTPSTPAERSTGDG